MPQKHKQAIGGVQYGKPRKTYLAKRGLRRYAGVWSLWALGVGAAISGDFFGWHFGLEVGGFGGLLIAGVIVTVMYLGLCCSVAEMSTALPFAGGAYAFARAAMGPWGGFLAGISQTVAYVLLPAVIVVGIGGYLGAIFDTPDSFAPIWWLATYAIFVGLNIWGAEIAFRAAVILTLGALAILAVFAVGAIPHFSWDMALDIAPDTEGGSPFLPRGVWGVAAALPFAIWFYLAIDQVPLAAEDSQDPRKDVPKAILLSLSTLTVTGMLVLFLVAGMAPGAARLAESPEPLFLGFQTIFGAGLGVKVLALILLAAPIASFHAIVFAYGRNIYALSRAGYFPRWLSITHDKHKTPHFALIAGATIGYVAAAVIYFSEAIFGTPLVGAVLLNMAVFGAVISYAMQAMSFVMLRQQLPDMARPFRSPLGEPGAWTALIIALVTFVFLFAEPAYRPGAIGCAIWYALALIYFAVHGRKALMLAPEEVAALGEYERARGESAEAAH
jgi:ethanolamine permease